MDAQSDKINYNTPKIAICVVVIVCILIIIYYLFCYFSGDDDGFLGGKSDISVGWNIEDMVNKIHNRQRNNLSRLSKNSQYNI